MSGLPPSLQRVIDGFARFPGIGKKTAQRLGLYVLQAEDGTIEELAQALLTAKSNINFCPLCHHITEESPCQICQDEKRDRSLICVVEEAADVLIFERTDYRGQYHVLGGVLSPLDGVGPDDLNIKSLLDRVGDAQEVIVATNASVEGETTALYLSKLLKPLGIRVTRLARGLPVGGHLEYIDEATLLRSINERVEVD